MLYEISKNMKKFLAFTVFSLALAATPVFAATSTTGTANKTTTATVNLACVQNAVAARDNAIISALATYQAAWTAALQARVSALTTAWGNTNVTTRRAAIKTAWSQYNSAKKSAQTAFNTARKNAWSTYSSSSKTCKMSTADDTTGASVDNQSQ